MVERGRQMMQKMRMLSLLALLAGLVGLAAGCVPHVPPGPDLPESPGQCCIPQRERSEALIAMYDDVAPVLLALPRDLYLRQGFLSQDPAVAARIAAQAQPLDLILVSFKHHLAGRLSQGYLNHAALWLGTEAQLRALDLWDDPAILPLQQRIRAGAVVIEANGRPVELSTPVAALNADGIVLLRPRGIGRAERAASLRRLAGLDGMPFDPRFNAATPDCVYCTELADRAMPDLHLPRQDIYGRPVIQPDSIVIESLAGRVSLDMVDFLYADRQGWQVGDADLLSRTIAANWPPHPDRP